MDEGLGQFGDCEEKGRMVGVTRIPRVTSKLMILKGRGGIFQVKND